MKILRKVKAKFRRAFIFAISGFYLAEVLNAEDRMRRGCMNPRPCLHCDHDCRAAHELARQLSDTTKRMLAEHDERIAALETDREENTE